MASSEKMKKVHQIMDLACEINKGKPSVFVRFSGHIDAIDVDIYYDGWGFNKNADVRMTAYLSGSLYKLNDLNKIIKALKRGKQGA